MGAKEFTTSTTCKPLSGEKPAAKLRKANSILCALQHRTKLALTSRYKMLYPTVFLCSGFTTDPANKAAPTAQAPVACGVHEGPALKDFSRGSEQLKVAIRSYSFCIFTLSLHLANCSTAFKTS